jgi:hypothetical protein
MEESSTAMLVPSVSKALTTLARKASTADGVLPLGCLTEAMASSSAFCSCHSPRLAQAMGAGSPVAPRVVTASSVLAARAARGSSWCRGRCQVAGQPGTQPTFA